MVKRAGSLIMVLAILVSLAGCRGKKPVELTPEENELIRGLTKTAVTMEALDTYGYEPGVVIDKVDADKSKRDVYYRIDFTSSGTYSLKDDNGDLYTGRFTVKGYREGHGSGWDKCEITPPKNGSKALPAQSTEAGQDISKTTSETTVLTLRSEVMIKLSEKYKSDGYSIMVCDPETEYEKCYGAKEHFRAYKSDSLLEVYLYDSRAEAMTAQNKMFGGGDGRTTGAEAETEIVEKTVLVAKFKR